MGLRSRPLTTARNQVLYKRITHDSLGAVLDRRLHPGWGFCGRCGYTWQTVKSHVTDYTESKGCFPLCEGCWVVLGSPEARIEYYANLIEVWESTGSEVSDDEKNDIKRAVANGG